MSDDSKFRFAKLGESNYSSWSMMMEADLIVKGLFTDIVEISVDTVDSEGSPRSQDDIDAEIEKKRIKRSAGKMAEARSRMILSVEPGQLVHMRNKDPLEVWEDLKAVHRARGFATVLSHRRKFLTMKMLKGQKMSGWIGEVKSQAFEMEELGIVVADQDIILALTMGLPHSYEPLIIAFDNTPATDLTLEYVIIRLLNDEIRQKTTPGGTTTTSTADTKTNNLDVAMLAQATKPRTPLEQITCYFCDDKGHYKQDCPKRKMWEAAQRAEGGAHFVEDDFDGLSDDVDDCAY